MSIVVTGATGQLGGLAVRALLKRGVAAGEIVATGRDATRLAELGTLGVSVRHAEYTDLASLTQAFVGGERLLFVSSSETDRRVEQAHNVVQAARQVGAGLIAYTSIAKADTSSLLLAAEHRATEQIIRESGLPYAFLRNSWYLENYTSQIPAFLESGVILGSAQSGRVSAATRADFADAAAAVLTGNGHAGKAYELGGDDAFTMAEFASALSAASGKPVTYQDLPPEEYASRLVDLGLPQPVAQVFADSDTGLARGDLFVESGDLSRLNGRPTISIADAIAAALAHA